MFNALDFDSMSLLLANEKPAIGVPVAKTLKYYIDRALECKKYFELRSENESEVQNHLGKAPWRSYNALVHIERKAATSVAMSSTILTCH